MDILNYALLIVIFCVTPAFVIWLSGRVSVINKIGPIMVLYAIGMVMGNLPFMPTQLAQVQDLLPNIMIPLAIPMMLYGCSFSSKQAGLQLKIVVSGFLSVVIAVAVGYLLFGSKIDEGAEVGGIITGMYTGGTLNAAALQTIFNIKGETYVLINSYDIIISFVYFVFLFTCGIKFFRRLYGQKAAVVANNGDDIMAVDSAESVENPYMKILSRAGMKQLAVIAPVTILLVAVSAGVALLLPGEWFMIIFILLLTTLGVVCSFNRKIRSLDLSYYAGMYLIYIFSMVIASMADFSNLNLADGINQLAFMVIAVFLSLTLHAIFCRLMRVDADSMVISSVAFINSPPFVPMVVAVMKNKSVLVTGLAAGVVGYAAGNHLGVLIGKLLALL